MYGCEEGISREDERWTEEGERLEGGGWDQYPTYTCDIVKEHI